MKSLACSIITSTALVVTSFAPDRADRYAACFLVLVFGFLTAVTKDKAP